MAKTSLYLPDDLAEQVRAHGISISEVAQAALRKAVRDAEIKENVMTDIGAVAERMRGLQREAAEQVRAQAEHVRSLGVEWAQETASAEALQYVAEWDNGRPADSFEGPATMIYGEGYPGSPKGQYWAEFQAGAREIWEQVKPLLTEIDEHGQTLPAGSGGTAGQKTRVRPRHSHPLEVDAQQQVTLTPDPEPDPVRTGRSGPSLGPPAPGTLGTDDKPARPGRR